MLVEYSAGCFYTTQAKSPTIFDCRAFKDAPHPHHRACDQLDVHALSVHQSTDAPDMYTHTNSKLPLQKHAATLVHHLDGEEETTSLQLHDQENAVLDSFLPPKNNTINPHSYLGHSNERTVSLLCFFNISPERSSPPFLYSCVTKKIA